MAGSGGPWGGGGGSGDEDRGGRDDGRRGGGRRPGEGPQIPEIDELMKRGTEHLRVLMGGRGGRPNAPGGAGPQGPMVTRQGVMLGILAKLMGIAKRPVH